MSTDGSPLRHPDPNYPSIEIQSPIPLRGFLPSAHILPSSNHWDPDLSFPTNSNIPPPALTDLTSRAGSFKNQDEAPLSTDIIPEDKIPIPLTRTAPGPFVKGNTVVPCLLVWEQGYDDDGTNSNRHLQPQTSPRALPPSSQCFPNTVAPALTLLNPRPPLAPPAPLLPLLEFDLWPEFVRSANPSPELSTEHQANARTIMEWQLKVQNDSELGRFSPTPNLVEADTSALEQPQPSSHDDTFSPDVPVLGSDHRLSMSTKLSLAEWLLPSSEAFESENFQAELEAQGPPPSEEDLIQEPNEILEIMNNSWETQMNCGSY